MVDGESDDEDGPKKRETRPSLALRRGDQGGVIGDEELGIGDIGGGAAHHGIVDMDEILGLLSLGGCRLHHDERLNAGRQIVGIRHPEFQGQEFLGKGRRHNMCAKDARETNGHGGVDRLLEDVSLLCLGLREPSPTRPVQALQWSQPGRGAAVC